MTSGNFLNSLLSKFNDFRFLSSPTSSGKYSILHFSKIIFSRFSKYLIFFGITFIFFNSNVFKFFNCKISSGISSVLKQLPDKASFVRFWFYTIGL